MAGGSKGRQETEAERAMAEVATAKMRDYQQRWAPLIQRTAEVVRGLREPDAFEREQARGRAATETEAQFGRAEQAVEAGLQGRGIGAGSSAFRLAKVNLGTDRARSRGLAVGAADQAVDQAYVEGLTNLMAIGRGKEASATAGLEQSAVMSARQARSDAELAAAQRAGRAELIATGAGMGFGYGYDRFPRRPSSTQGGANMAPSMGLNTVTQGIG